MQVRVRILLYVFFFQAEDGIRDLTVTGVQTCALPISPSQSEGFEHERGIGWTILLCRRSARRSAWQRPSAHLYARKKTHGFHHQSSLRHSERQSVWLRRDSPASSRKILPRFPVYRLDPKDFLPHHLRSRNS